MAPPAQIYQAVVNNALRLLNGDSGSLRFLDLADPNWSEAVAWHGSAGEGERWRHRAPISEGLSGRVLSTGKPIALEDYPAARTGSQLAPPATQAILGVPIFEQNQLIGSLVVGSTITNRHWTKRELDLLVAYGKQASVALRTAKASDTSQQALTDPLTGLANRRLLLDCLQHELVRSDRDAQAVTVLFIDLDGFKLVNDSLGHLFGDQLLVAVAERLRKCVRDSDICARIGGDEFGVLLIGKSDPDVVAERIVAAVQRRFQIDSNEVSIGVSVGIASGRNDAETLLRHADVAMYHAKRSVATHFAHFAPCMQAALTSRLKLDTELRRAIERDEFELHYQPMYDLPSGKLAAFEGLVRWHHPTRGLVSPPAFIAMAEQNDVIVDIGRWVLERGCSQLAAWRREAPIAVSLNVSTRELRHGNYVDRLRRVLDGSFPPSALILEVTEREPLEEMPGVTESLHAIKALGVRVALDDFGTGYCTLQNLFHLPVDILKIAKLFLDASEPGLRNAPGLLAGIIGLGQHLGLTTVGEGIERADQRALLTELGCDLGQGYFLGRPLDEIAATKLLAAEFGLAPVSPQ